MSTEQNEAAPVDAEGIETAIDTEGSSAGGDDFDTNRNPEPFENIETGALEQDIATHEPPATEETSEGMVLDLGRVEGLSGAPSTLRGTENSEEMAENSESGTMEKPSSQQ